MMMLTLGEGIVRCGNHSLRSRVPSGPTSTGFPETFYDSIFVLCDRYLAISVQPTYATPTTTTVATYGIVISPS